MRYFVCSTISLLELLINPSAYNVGGITHYFSRCKSNDHLMHWGIKIRAWRAWIFNTQMDSFLQKVRMIFQQFSKFALSSKLKHLYLGWLWQQPLLLEKIDKFWDCGFLIGYLEAALHSFDLWILIPAHLYGPGHWELVRVSDWVDLLSQNVLQSSEALARQMPSESSSSLRLLPEPEPESEESRLLCGDLLAKMMSILDSLSACQLRFNN